MKSVVYFSDRQSAYEITAETRRVLRHVIIATLNKEKFPYPAEVSVSFVSLDEIHSLNKEYRNTDRPTDVLSFPTGDTEPTDSGRAVIGDIVISTEKALQQAREYGHGVMRELAFLSVHSTLHLLGYDHETSKEDEEYMQKTQEEILVKSGLPRNV